MKLKSPACVVVFLLSALWTAVSYGELPVMGTQYQRPDVYVAHAGGRIDGMAYTNSLEALEANYLKGYRMFELDFSWTADDQLVLIHDWDQTWVRFAPSATAVPSLPDFLQTDHSKGLRFLSLDDLLEWLRLRPDAKVVTDVKHRNVEALQQISLQASSLRDRFVPQIYEPQEYGPVRASGFKQVLFTIYKSKLTEGEIIDFVTENALAGLVIPEYRAKRGDFQELLANRRLKIFVHTINDEETWQSLRSRGYHGVYTDDLLH